MRRPACCPAAPARRPRTGELRRASRVPDVPRDRLPASAIANQTDAWLFRAPGAGQQAVHLPLPAGQSVLIGLAAAVVVLAPPLRAPTEHFTAMPHEGGHALLAVILGLTVTGIMLHQRAALRHCLVDHQGRPGHLDDHADGGSVRTRVR